MAPAPNRYVRQAVILSLFAGAALVGLVTGVLFAYAPDLPEIEALDDYAPDTITRVHARGGELIGEFATERRDIIGYDDIPEVLRNAIIAAEDASFFDHQGISIPAGIRTVIQNVAAGDLTAAGASTLTMQLARNIEVAGRSLGLQKAWQRKAWEVYYTFLIEKRYTKREILALYANQIWLGTARHAAHGVEAAAQLYFGKSAGELELGEAALIAGILQSPARWSPLVNMERATERRNYALGRMAAEGYVTEAVAAAEMAKPITLAPRRRRANTIAPYFLEEIRQHLEAGYGAQRLYEDGLVVHSTLDIDLQRAANRAVSEGLRAVDKRHGFRGARRNVLRGDDAVESIDAFEHFRWRLPIAEGDMVPAVVTGTTADTIRVRVGPHVADIDADGFAWTRKSSPDELVEVGDLIDVTLTTLPDGGGRGTAALDQEPEVEGALVAIDNRTGHVLAMVGGYDFERSRFNRATQAFRQLGSLFKGVLYAAAVDQGHTTTSILQDEPVAFEVGPGQPRYRPSNYDYEFKGPVTLRYALETSRNVPAVWIMNEVSPEVVVDFARRVGFSSPIPPYLSVALGSAEATLMEVTSAYSVFPSQGRRMLPFLIERVLDRNGDLLEENRPQSRDALRPDTAYIMASLMRGVVQRGTGRRALQLNWPVGGKTGTVDDFTDAWFVGFDPDITLGVWVGHDEKKTMGNREEGARVALPIWIDFMKAYVAGRGETRPAFDPPTNIVFASVDRETGKPVARGTPGSIEEAFIAGTEPGTAFFR